MKAFEVLFWISLFIVFYTYIGYGILLYILVKIKECFRKPAPRPMPADDALPSLTLFIAAYNLSLIHISPRTTSPFSNVFLPGNSPWKCALAISAPRPGVSLAWEK